LAPKTFRVIGDLIRLNDTMHNFQRRRHKIWSNHITEQTYIVVFVRRWIKELENMANHNCPLLQTSSLIEMARNAVRMLLS